MWTMRIRTAGRRSPRILALLSVGLMALGLSACLPVVGSSGGSVDNVLQSGDTLSTGDQITSANGMFFLAMQGDGNLVEYMYDGSMTPAIWASGTAGQGPSHLVMQGDGNLVIYRNSSGYTWASGTAGQGDSYLRVQDDGNLVVYRDSGGYTWASGYAPAPGTPVPSGSSALPVNSSLLPGSSLNDNGFTLTMGNDGTFMAVAPSGEAVPAGTIATEGAAGNPGAYLDMEPSGNLVEQTPQGEVVWQTGTNGFNQCLMGDQSTGTPVVSVHTWWSWDIWSVTPCYMGGWMKPAVGIIGDSITEFSQTAIENTLGTSVTYTISGQGGWTISEQMAGIDSALNDPEGAPADVLINLGTNDVFTNNVNWQSDYNAMISAVQGRSCVILTTINTYADATRNNTIAIDINAAEQATVAAHSNFHILDWNSFLNQGDNRSTLLISDGIHPNSAGQVVLAQMYDTALVTDCGA